MEQGEIAKQMPLDFFQLLVRKFRRQGEVHVADRDFKWFSRFGDDLHDAETLESAIGIFGLNRHGELQVAVVEQGWLEGTAFARAQVDAGFIMIRQFKFAKIFVGCRQGGGAHCRRGFLRRRIF